jgi:hypothetical protein
MLAFVRGELQRLRGAEAAGRPLAPLPDITQLWDQLRTLGLGEPPPIPTGWVSAEQWPSAPADGQSWQLITPEQTGERARIAAFNAPTLEQRVGLGLVEAEKWLTQQAGRHGAPAGEQPAEGAINESELAAKAEDRYTAPKAVHNSDFTMVNWFGTEHHFCLGVQSTAVKVLWEEWERSGLGLHQDTIRVAIDEERDNFRMDNAFRNHPAFGTMIQRCGDGRYRLAPPGAQQPTAAPKVGRNTKNTSKSRRKRG